MMCVVCQHLEWAHDGQLLLAASLKAKTVEVCKLVCPAVWCCPRWSSLLCVGVCCQVFSIDDPAWHATLNSGGLAGMVRH